MKTINDNVRDSAYLSLKRSVTDSVYTMCSVKAPHHEGFSRAWIDVRGFVQRCVGDPVRDSVWDFVLDTKIRGVDK